MNPTGKTSECKKRGKYALSAKKEKFAGTLAELQEAINAGNVVM